MKLSKLRLENFRCFADLELELHPQLTVLVAENGQGKTAILDGIATGLGTFLTYLPNVSGINPKATDFRVQDNGKKPPYMRVRLEADNGIAWDRTEKRDKTKSTAELVPEAHGQRSIKQYAISIFENWFNRGQCEFPMLAYYGTGRAVFDTPQKRRNFRKEFAINDAYQGALEAKTNFRRFFEYFYFLEDMERREKEKSRDWGYRQPELETIREAIHRMMPEFSNPHSEVRPLRLMVEWRHNNREQLLRIEQLSDGYRTTLTMVMDIATRLAELKPAGALSLDAAGIVLIDEVDLHLHPSWQQRILPDLQRTFPNVQFIVTTHSPQVLTSVPAECIRVLVTEQDEETGQNRIVIKLVTQQTQGVASSDALAEVMGIDPVPDVEQAHQLSEYMALIQQGLHDSVQGLALRVQLNQHFGAEHPRMLECQRLIRLQAFKRQLPPRPADCGDTE